MTSVRPSDQSAHDQHDPAIIAGLLDRDGVQALPAAERATALALVDDCVACAALHRELVALTSGLRLAGTPTRPRDFRLSAADAVRLQPRGWRRFITSIGSARDGLSRPLAIGLTTLGLVGVLVGTVPGALPLGGPAAGVGTGAEQTPSDRAGAQGGAQEPAPVIGAPGSVPDPTAQMEIATDVPGDAAAPTDDGSVFSGSELDGSAVKSDDANRDALAMEEARLRDDGSGMSLAIVLGGTMLILGLGLFALRWTSRRLG